MNEPENPYYDRTPDERCCHEAWERGRDAERARIVAWLREHAAVQLGTWYDAPTLREAANLIETHREVNVA